ncbi:hypothetical protein ACP70R_014610 [Stipagrostis hirtigluma subsp. patula]
MLGLLSLGRDGTRFTPTSSLRLSCAARPNWYAVDAHHGRILFCAFMSISMEFIVLNPKNGEERRLDQQLDWVFFDSWGAALLCAAAGCDHLDGPCDGPFTVVVVATGLTGDSTAAIVYSSECSTLVGNALYFIYEKSLQILEYDLGRQELSVISPPSVNKTWMAVIVAAEGGGFGFAAVQESKLHMWSREAGLNGWAKCRVIELQSLFPVCALSTLPKLAAISGGAGLIFMWSRDTGVVSSIDLKSGEVTEVARLSELCHLRGIVPYMSFYTPALGAASTIYGPRVGASDA